MNSQALGAWAETAALEHLERSGLTLLARNFRCRVGELDLVMEDDAALVFVEVRMRNDTRYGDAAASITPLKQRKLARAAGVFLMRHPAYQSRVCRFDVVSVSKRNYAAHCEWIRDAFS